MKKILRLFKNKQFLQSGIVLITVIIMVILSIFYLITENRISIEDSVVSSPIISVSPSTPGILKNIYVSSGNPVKKGDVLATVGTEILRSYSDGEVIDTNRLIGSVITAQTPVIRLINRNDMRIDGTIDENKGLNKIKIGQVVSFTIDAFPGRTYWGYVDEISKTAKQTQLSFSISSERPTQQFDVFVRFDAAKYSEIKNGMSAKITLYTTIPN